MCKFHLQGGAAGGRADWKKRLQSHSTRFQPSRHFPKQASWGESISSLHADIPPHCEVAGKQARRSCPLPSRQAALKWLWEASVTRSFIPCGSIRCVQGVARKRLFKQGFNQQKSNCCLQPTFPSIQVIVSPPRSRTLFTALFYFIYSPHFWLHRLHLGLFSFSHHVSFLFSQWTRTSHLQSPALCADPEDRRDRFSSGRVCASVCVSE